jgi:hypothetical protein
MDIQSIKTTNDLVEAIEERAGVGLRDGSVPLGQKYAWFDGKMFELFKQLPITKQPLAVFAMFQMQDEVRIYAVINAKEPPADPIVPYQRFSLSRRNATVFIDVFPGTEEEPLLGLETFVNCIVEDLQELAETNEAAEAVETLARLREVLEKGDLNGALAILKENENEEDEPAPESSPPNGEATQTAPVV